MSSKSTTVRAAIGRSLHAALRPIGFDLVRYRPEPEVALSAFEHLVEFRNALAHVVDPVERQFLNACVKDVELSKAQLLQDLFVLSTLDRKMDGFFVEFGATDGVNLSNTYLLETRFGWKGILAEPARCWASALKANRHCAIDLRCVWTGTGETLQFLETADAELSTIDPFASRDSRATERLDHEKYAVTTVSLTDLLRCHGAPRHIDYLSVDTEGSEHSILSAFDFSEFDIRIITVEHNHVEVDRRRIFDLLSSHGYRRVCEKFSKFDDWYVKDAS